MIVREICVYDSDSKIQTSPSESVSCTSVGAICVLGKLILQVTDSFFLRQNCGLQILKLLQQPLKQLRLDGRRDGKRKKGVGRGGHEEKGKRQ